MSNNAKSKSPPKLTRLLKSFTWRRSSNPSRQERSPSPTTSQPGSPKAETISTTRLQSGNCECCLQDRRLPEPAPSLALDHQFVQNTLSSLERSAAFLASTEAQPKLAAKSYLLNTGVEGLIEYYQEIERPDMVESLKKLL